MDEWAKLKEEFKEKITDFESLMLHKIEQAKQNEIILAIKSLNNRLEAIEKRLPPVEED